MLIVPYSTDAPIYHWPVATVGLIIANTAIFFAALFQLLPNPELWILPYGQGLTPQQWLLSMFMHADLGHLLGNMLFLWVFGLVIEGKLGWQRFLACYLTIGLVQSAGEQTLQLALGGTGGSLGASSAIYGLLAMAAIWAPKNDITFFYWVLLIYSGSFDVPIVIVALFYIGLDLVGLVLQGFQSSSWLHVGGALIGAPLAILLLRRGAVDCEGWDLFHVFGDEVGGKEPEEVILAQAARLQQERDAEKHGQSQAQLAFLCDAGNYLAAYQHYQKLAPTRVQLSRSQLVQMITALHQQQQWRDSCPLLAELVARFPDQSQGAVVKLAQICVLELQKPGRALELLQTLDLGSLPPAQLALVKKIAQRARQMQAEGVVELDDQAW